ncbi:MAG: tetraacyldisaccharide 4'-kinase [Candidatus Schekmanbacteria bacterium RBG_13_48_7]|uniref:Tetraacyldisaccharide 4'-kinase n=1 Tax=Candidatus Schekmanbacteria bacterium RBG_13_48_7 TaxID=1817878 RepID=A0A1F7RJH7_9BACT|nr:MAG: tetraacyldisaccharide 4'-kinase [Candidatus Schekmanbacteria bacterium RBG_13_48_7]
MDTQKNTVTCSYGFIKKLENLLGESNPSILRGVLRFILTLFSYIYWMILQIRYLLYRYSILPIRNVPVPVISVGNITAGGTGKTPFVIELANYYKDTGKEVAIVSRGYHRQADEKVQVVSDGKQILLSVSKAGDEPFLIAKKCPGVPVVVSKNRFNAAARCIQEFNSKLIILDDGFQHLGLFRDVDILLVDEQNPFSNKYLIPRGYLREPVTQLSRADILCMIRKYSHKTKDPDTKIIFKKPVFSVLYEPWNLVGSDLNQVASLEYLIGKNLIVFCGIGNPQPFLNWVNASGGSVKQIFLFDDHHNYKIQDMEMLNRAKENWNAQILLTTEKDIVKIAALNRNIEIMAVSMRLKLEDSETNQQVYEQINSLLFRNLQ